MSVLFDWRNFALAIAAHFSIAEPLTTFGLITSGTVSNVHHSSMLLVINMDIGRGHMSYAPTNCCVIMYRPVVTLAFDSSDPPPFLVPK